MAKGLSIRVGENGEAAVCYDTARPSLRGAWTGGFLKFDGRRFGLLAAPAPAAPWAFTARANCGWQDMEARHESMHLNGKRVVLDTRVGGTLVQESPWFESAGDVAVLTRTFEVAPGASALTQRIFSDPKAKSEFSTKAGVAVAVLDQGEKLLAVAVAGNSKPFLGASNGDISITFPPRTETMRAKLFLWSGAREKLADFEKAAAASSAGENLAELSKPGPGRWLPAITNAGRIGFPADGFAVDTITVPYANPWKALMFCSGVDFFSDGSAAVCTIHGDVWHVSGLDDKLRAVTWKRFATGLFQPLGLRVVNDRACPGPRSDHNSSRRERRRRSGSLREFLQPDRNLRQGGHDVM